MSAFSAGAAVTEALATTIQSLWSARVFIVPPKLQRASTLPAAILQWEMRDTPDASTVNHDGYAYECNITLLLKEPSGADWTQEVKAKFDALHSALTANPTFAGLLLPSMSSYTLFDADEEAIVGGQATLTGLLSVPRG